MPLTHYERTKKFASSEYGTTKMRLGGDTQQTFGYCSLGLTPIIDDEPDADSNKKAAAVVANSDQDDTMITTIATVTPSGHLYSPQAILEYLLTKTQDYQGQLTKYERQQADIKDPIKQQEVNKRERREAFARSQNLPQATKKAKTSSNKEGLQRTSYWLPTSQPEKAETNLQPPERPSSPHSGEPLRRKDLKPVALPRHKNSEDVICALSGKPIRHQKVMAYWTSNKDKDKTKPGVVCLKDVFDMTVAADSNDKDDGDKKPKAVTMDKDKKKNKDATKLLCPLTNQKIKQTLELKAGGSGFAAHNDVEVKTYRPTIT